jgi:hypothetical protein
MGNALTCAVGAKPETKVWEFRLEINSGRQTRHCLKGECDGATRPLPLGAQVESRLAGESAQARRCTPARGKDAIITDSPLPLILEFAVAHLRELK